MSQVCLLEFDLKTISKIQRNRRVAIFLGMNEQGIVTLISRYNEKKKADEEVEDENDVPQLSKCSFSHCEAMQKMDDYLV